MTAHELDYWLLHHLMAAHKDDMFGDYNYVAGHLMVVEGFVRNAIERSPDKVMQASLPTISAAALAHDFKEDHPKYWEEHKIADTLGRMCVGWIDECTDDQSLKRKVRKERQLKRITVMNRERFSEIALIIKLGDWYSHLMPWGDMEKVPGAIVHAKGAVQAVHMRLKRHRSPQIEVALRYAAMGLENTLRGIE
jgi:hypothetical protein